MKLEKLTAQWDTGVLTTPKYIQALEDLTRSRNKQVESLEAERANMQKAHQCTIRSYQKQSAELEAPKTCDGCKHRNGCEIKIASLHYLSWLNSREMQDTEFGCIQYEPKETPLLKNYSRPL